MVKADLAVLLDSLEDASGSQPSHASTQIVKADPAVLVDSSLTLQLYGCPLGGGAVAPCCGHIDISKQSLTIGFANNSGAASPPGGVRSLSCGLLLRSYVSPQLGWALLA